VITNHKLKSTSGLLTITCHFY